MTVVRVGRIAIAAALLNAPSFVAIGSGDTPVADSDTTLAVEEYRVTPTRVISSANRIQIRVLFPVSGLPAQAEEIGVFIGGSGTADSGRLMLRQLFSFTPGSSDLQMVIEVLVES